jgi:enoyl-CoA hydratase/carnithine racemase
MRPGKGVLKDRNANVSNVVITSREGPIATVTLNNPAGRNMISPEQSAGIRLACEQINDDPTIACVVLNAAGDVFSAGGNIKNMYNRTDHFAGNAAEIRRSYEKGVQQIARALYGLEAPVIAAVNGAAMGAGLDIAMMCDIRICSDNATFAESFIRLGLTSAAGGAWFLTRQLGYSRALELTLSGDTVDAARALELGIVSQVTTPAELMPAALAIAKRIARHPPHSIRLNKRLLRESARLDLPAALEMAASMQAIVQQTEDQYEAVAAAVEKRKPEYKGR